MEGRVVHRHEPLEPLPQEETQDLLQEDRDQSSEDTFQPVLQGTICAGAVVVCLILIFAVHHQIQSTGELGQCSDTPCPQHWSSSGSGGYFCRENNGCRPAADGPFPVCKSQCYIGTVPSKVAGTSGSPMPAPAQSSLQEPGNYDLRFTKSGKLAGCMAPISKFPGDQKYGCSGSFDTAPTCDAASHPIKDTKYVAAVHSGCATAQGQGTYGYAYDDGVGLRQCSPFSRYEWILCPSGSDSSITWEAEPSFGDSSKRFRVTNRCQEKLWITCTGTALPHDPSTLNIKPGESYTYSIPSKGLPSTRFLPKVGCNEAGNNCNVQSVPPCPQGGCDPPIDSKFEASFGCSLQQAACSITGQGQPSTYQDWIDGSAVDGWTLPFSILVDDGGKGLTPGSEESSPLCSSVICPNLVADKLCPQNEWLTPEG
mmetsp:Transcript_85462/g.151130  ORF Transcript_85462/g.151130 Transcript_85462/m.151130 type:complete len:426 (-) Transcript_85462:70-1347(-)